MKRLSPWFRVVLLASLVALALLLPPPPLANPIVPHTLAFEREGLDLDTSTIVPVAPWPGAWDPTNPQPDLVLAYNSERTVCTVVIPNRRNGVQVAFLHDIPFNLVSSADLADLSFTMTPVDAPFEVGDSIVVRTDTGAHYLVGNPIEGSGGVTVDTQLLDESTAGLIRPDATTPSLASVPSNAPSLSSRGISATGLPTLADSVGESGYEFQAVTGRQSAFTTRNPVHGLNAELDDSGLHLASSPDTDWNWSLELVGYGYAGSLVSAVPGALFAKGNRLEHRRENLIEWYVNDRRGLEQGFTLAAPPPGDRTERLSLKLAASGSLTTVVDNESDVRLIDQAGRTVLRYAGLLAWDATGRELPARLASSSDGLLIEVDDRRATYPVTIDPTVVRANAKMTAGDAASFDEFGESVAISGNTALIGTAAADAAYVFVRSGTNWIEQARLTANGAAPEDEFGLSAAVSGDTVVVGAPGDDHAGGPSTGSALVFVRNGASWTEQVKLTAGDAAPGDRFGSSVAISGDTIVVGAPRDSHNGGVLAGSAYVFVRDGAIWTQQAKLRAFHVLPGKFFGWSVAISGNTVIVGGPFFDRGSAFVFVRSGQSWGPQTKLRPSDAADTSQFGGSVAISGDTVVVGAHNDNVEIDTHHGTVVLQFAGSAFVYARNGSNWSERARLEASDAAAIDLFGVSVAVSGDDTVVVGSSGDDTPDGANAGSAYVFVPSGDSWSEETKLAASDAGFFDFFGTSVAISGDVAVVGSIWDDHGGGTNAGSAYAFHFNEPPVARCRDVIAIAGADCTADASIDDGSFDPAGNPITLEQSPSGPYGLGDTAVTLTATNDQGDSGICQATVTVEDTTGPELSVTLAPDTLWPPNHHVVDVEASVVASDNCGAPTIALASLTSNEADDAPGDGDGATTNDIQLGVDDFHFSLRAERAGEGGGRVYTAVYAATDGSGNVTPSGGFAVVPHDQGGVSDPVEITLTRSPTGTSIAWPPVTAAVSYDVVRGDLHNLAETDIVIDLGTVVCIEADSADENTAGHEDGDLPLPGQAFFYLVQFDDGISSTYGTVSAEKPRAPGPGDCP
ncbi:MAG: hypothetical protein GTN89_09370 [Acidobacteria bacterium]|nr:hypothetical protein [Acidobacteriota bacterium]NIM60722.1 hypothetical protein [Acidobacteriota bacterium]NIO59542.1 hypothetical protein [Acidobacteriota bacterium]NIQ30563.1 hypothetical protein [Acidobacteriota bacterium]NIQ85528.1 hypothetical protein [Acidobacteriota bacterium]